MDIGEIEKVGDREMPGLPRFPDQLPAKPPQQQPVPERSPAPVKTPEREKV